jgi:hypothetical protein
MCHFSTSLYQTQFLCPPPHLSPLHSDVPCIDFDFDIIHNIQKSPQNKQYTRVLPDSCLFVCASAISALTRSGIKNQFITQ